MSLKEKINQAKIVAMKARDAKRNGAFILIKSAVTQYEVDNRVEATDDIVLTVLNRMVKQRKDSIEQYEKASRQDLVDVEKYELNVISEFLPEQVSAEEVEAVIKEAIASAGATSVKDLGKVMGIIKAELNGKADIGEASKKAKELLA